ncbi:MAG: penicillin acylase family protein [Acidobacteria bacterium]|nr:penicillin acylase family protein [Acidobacteriota bacterium]
MRPSLPVLLFSLALALAQPRFPQKTITVDGETATIVRDDFGVPHISAPSERALFYANGYAVAEDRLWQLERYRRDATGRMAEIEGKTSLERDREVRRRMYTRDEIERLWDSADPGVKLAFQAYADGINARLQEGNLPAEFTKRSLTPDAWSVLDSVAIGVVMAHRFGSGGGGEVNNLKTLRKLKQKFGNEKARTIFNDLYWRNDPRAPTTIAAEDMAAPAWSQATPGEANWKLADLRLSDAALERAESRAAQREILAANERLGLPTRWGSYAIVLAPGKSVTGNPILIGGPQMGFATPQIAHEVHLSGPGLNAIGMGFAGMPGVLIGHNPDLAWTTTSGIDDLVDVFAEKLDPQNKHRYQFKGEWKEMACRVETILVRGAEPEKLEVCRTVHGPVIEWDEPAGVAYTLAAAFRGKELETMRAILGFNRARTIQEFAQGASLIWLSHNFFVATRTGDIGYWHCSRPPLRNPQYDPRLPLPGTGESEWQGFIPFEQMPQVINPQRGYLVNWNNKPAPWWPNFDAPVWGEIFRIHRIEQLIQARPKLTFEQARAILVDIGVNDPTADYLKPYILRALEPVTASNAAARRIADVLAAWDNHAEDDSVAKSIFDNWVRAVREVIWREDLRDVFSRSDFDRVLQPSAILHILEGADSGVPLNYDALHGKKPGEAITQAMVLTIAEMQKKEPNPYRWGYRQSSIDFKPLPPIPSTNRGTYIQIVELARPQFRAVSILPPGQSEDPASPHFGDQRELAGYWKFKPMRLSFPD